MNPKKMGDYPQNTKKPEGEQKRRYKAAYNQRALRLGLAVREKTVSGYPCCACACRNRDYDGQGQL
jgi:hypothetical protein